MGFAGGEKFGSGMAEKRFFRRLKKLWHVLCMRMGVNLSMDSPRCERPLILIVEDDTDQQKVLVDILAACDLSCIATKSIAEGLAALKCHRISLTLLDWELPDGLGSRFLREAKGEHPLVPVVVMSGKPYDVRTDAMVEEADAFLTKPWNAAVLTNQVTQLLKLSQAAQRGLLPKDENEILSLRIIKEV